MLYGPIKRFDKPEKTIYTVQKTRESALGPAKPGSYYESRSAFEKVMARVVAFSFLETLNGT